MKKGLKEMCQELSVTEHKSYVPHRIFGIHDHLREINRGAGIHRPKKGKGSYTRKTKHCCWGE